MAWLFELAAADLARGTMNVTILIFAIGTLTVLSLLVADRLLSDVRNISRLAQHFGWARSDAAVVYAAARRGGFGQAYQARGRGPAAVL